MTRESGTSTLGCESRDLGEVRGSGSGRGELVEMIAEYRERYPEEAPLVDRFAAFVRQHERCLDRDFGLGHVTASAWVVDPGSTDVLLTHHRKLDIWVQLGGHLEANENVLEGAVREAREESGLGQVTLVSAEPRIFDLDIHTIPERRRSDGCVEAAHEHFDVRFALRAGDRRFVVSEESHDLAWIPVVQLRRWTDEESMLRMARKWSSGME